MYKTLEKQGNSVLPKITVFAPLHKPKVQPNLRGFMQFICTLEDSDTEKLKATRGLTITRTDGSTEDALLVLTNDSEFSIS